MKSQPTYKYIIAWVLAGIIAGIGYKILYLILGNMSRGASISRIEDNIIIGTIVELFIFFSVWYFVYGILFKKLNMKRVFPYMIFLAWPLCIFRLWMNTKEMKDAGFFTVSNFSIESFFFVNLAVLSASIWIAVLIFKKNPQRWYDNDIPQPLQNDQFNPPLATAVAKSRQNPAERFFSERESQLAGTNSSEGQYTVRRINADTKVSDSSDRSSDPSAARTERYPNAALALKYRPEIKSIMEQNQALLSFDILRIHQTLEANPQISASDLSEFVEKIKTGNEGPFANHQYNKIYSELYELGSKYQEKFMKIHDTLGDTFDPKLVLSEFEKEIQFQKATMDKQVQDSKNKQNFIDNLILIKSLPTNQYETKNDRITLDSNLLTKISKTDNLIQHYYSEEHLSDSLNYNLYGNITLNRYLISYEKYKGFLIMKVGDGKVYVTNILTNNIKRASQQYYTISGLKKSIDNGEIK